MRRFLTAALLVAIVGTSGACAGTTDDTATPATSAGTTGATTAAASPSVDVAANTKDICAKSEALFNEADLTDLGKQIGAIIAARQVKNAAAEATAKTAIKAKTDTWAKQIGELQTQAADPALKTSLGVLSTALTTIATDQYLAGFTSINDVSKLQATLKTATDAMTKVCG